MWPMISIRYLKHTHTESTMWTNAHCTSYHTHTHACVHTHRERERGALIMNIKRNYSWKYKVQQMMSHLSRVVTTLLLTIMTSYSTIYLCQYGIL